jgi:very-short-patch-repair endonuclease
VTARDWLRARANKLRTEMTPHEKAMWGILRQGELAALNWRRQVAFGGYILDFASHPARLVIEVDGAQHAHAENAEADAARTAWLNAEGYQVLRFWNVDVLNAQDGVWRAIHAAAMVTPAAVRMRRWRQRESAQIHETNARPASSSMEEAPRSGGGGARATLRALPHETPSSASRATPPQSSLRDDSSSVEEERR